MMYNLLHFSKDSGIGTRLVKTDHPQNDRNLAHMLSLMEPGMDEAHIERCLEGTSRVSEDEARQKYGAAGMTVRRRCRYGDFFVRPGRMMLAMLHVTDAKCGYVRVMVPDFVLSDGEPAMALNRIMHDAAGGRPEAWTAFMRYDPARLAAYGVRIMTDGPFDECPGIPVIETTMWTDVPVSYRVEKTVPAALAKRVSRYLTNEEHLGEDDTITETVTFPDGMQMDVKCCGTQDTGECAWTEAVLFEPNGAEACCTDVEEEFLGEWSIERDGITYVAVITVE